MLQGATFLVVTVAWVFFRTPTLGAAGHYLAALVGLGGSGPTHRTNWWAALHAAATCWPSSSPRPSRGWLRRVSAWPPRSPRPGPAWRSRRSGWRS
ncbi:MAG: hypothetical protein MZV64_25145 [Ignavibacteriales bacterium]|nr:hypothetical protein [Ignavibacteriales bacterium]